MAGQFLDRLDRKAVFRHGDGERVAFQPGAAGATDAMHVILGMDRHVEIEHVRQAADIQAAGGDIAAHQQSQLAGLEFLQRGEAHGLRHVAMQRAGVELVLDSDLYRISTSILRLQKINAFCTFSFRINRRSASRLSCSATSARPSVMVVATVADRETVISFGFCRNASARRLISGPIVAEKNSVCRFFGSSETIRSTSGMKPMSSIRSASSITRMRVSVSRIVPRSNMSISRPGVAIRTSTPRFSTSF